MNREELMKTLLVEKPVENIETYDKNEVEILLAQLIDVIYKGYFISSERTQMIYQLNLAYDHMMKILDEETTLAFFEKINDIREVLNTDAQAIYDGDPAATSLQEVVISYPGFYAITVYRIAHQLYLADKKVIARMMSEIAHSKTGIDIHPGATIDTDFFIDHGTGIVIGETTNIGKHVKLYQGVTLGALSTRGGQSLKGKKRHPTIMDNVTVYAGASVLGDIVIGENCVIGSNVFITKPIEANTKVYLESQQLKYK